MSRVFTIAIPVHVLYKTKVKRVFQARIKLLMLLEIFNMMEKSQFKTSCETTIIYEILPRLERNEWPPGAVL